MRRTILILSVVALAAVPALADDAGVAVVGGAVQLLDEHADVRMLSARVTADMYFSVTDVCCEYELKNEGRSQLVTLGFPDRPGSFGNQHHLTDFRSWVDGDPLQVEIYNAPEEAESRIKRWYVRKIWFARGQTRRVVNTYQQPHYRNTSGTRYFPYTIWTAGSWKGPIDEMTITVHWREPYLWVYRPPEHFDLPAISSDGHTLTWTWADLEPTREHVGYLRVSFYPGWRSVTVDGEEDEPGYDDFLMYPPGIMMAPVRRLADLLYLHLVWADRVLVLSDDASHYFVCSKGSRVAAANGEQIILKKRPFVGSFYSEMMYAPLRPICDAFGVQISLDYDNHLIELEHEDPQPAVSTTTQQD